MALSTSRAEQERQAGRDLAAKMRLEVGLARDMRGFFKDIRRDFQAIYTAGGINITARDFRPDLVAILRKHYRKVARKFGSQFRRQIDKAFQIDFTKQNEGEQADEAIRQLINQRANQQADFILRTTQSEYDAALAAAVGAALVAGTLQDRAGTARAVTSSLVARQTARADAIATTEVNAIAERSKQIEVRVIMDSGATVDDVPLQNNTVKIWNAVLDERTRINHAAADGQIQELGNPFNVGGQFLMHPSDTSLGATVDNIINCFLPDTGIQGNIICASEARYSGHVVVIETAAGRRLTITPNHPILSSSGFKAAGDLAKGDYLFAQRNKVKNSLGIICDDVKRMPASASHIFHTLIISGQVRKVVATSVDFHGDAESLNSNINIVFVNSFLQNYFQTMFFKFCPNLSFIQSDILTIGLPRQSFGDQFLFANFSTLHSFMRSLGLPFNGFGAAHFDEVPLYFFRLGLCSSFDSIFKQYSSYNAPGNPMLFAQSIFRNSEMIISDEIINIDLAHYSGPVYDFMSDSGYVIADDFIVSNCRCSSQFLLRSAV